MFFMDMFKRSKTFIFLFFFLIGLFPPKESFSNETLLKEKQSRPFFGTIVHIEVCYAKGSLDVTRYAIDRVWESWERIQKKTNRYDAKSEISLLNASQGRAIWVDRDIARLLRRAIAFKNETRGIFDITITPLIEFWKEQAQKNEWPQQEEVVKIKQKVDANKIKISRTDHVSLPDNMLLDLNGIVPGFAADEAFRILKDNGVLNFLVDAGGEIIVSGHNCERKPWRIGIKDPQNTNHLMGAVDISQGAVSTSGDYERFFDIQGKKYSRMINPITGYPSIGVMSATVIAPTALEADVLSTVLCILGPRDGFNLIRTLGDDQYSALILLRQQKGEKTVLHQTKNFKLSY